MGSFAGATHQLRPYGIANVSRSCCRVSLPPVRACRASISRFSGTEPVRRWSARCWRGRLAWDDPRACSPTSGETQPILSVPGSCCQRFKWTRYSPRNGGWRPAMLWADPCRPASDDERDATSERVPPVDCEAVASVLFSAPISPDRVLEADRSSPGSLSSGCRRAERRCRLPAVSG